MAVGRLRCETKLPKSDAFDELIANQKARLKGMGDVGSTVTYRAATLDDADGIITVLEEVAPEIPISSNTPDEQRRLLVVTGECRSSGESLAAIDAASTIVGFVLSRSLPHKGTDLFLEYRSEQKLA